MVFVFHRAAQIFGGRPAFLVFYVLGVAGVRFRDVVGQAGEAALVQGEVFNSVFSAQAPKLYHLVHRQPAVQY